MTDNAYEPSRVLARTLLAPLGIETRFFDPLDLDGFAAQFDERTTRCAAGKPRQPDNRSVRRPRARRPSPATRAR